MGWLQKAKEESAAVVDNPMTACGSLGPNLTLGAVVLVVVIILYLIVNVVRNWNERVKQFSEAAFDAVDVDNNGKLDAKEVEIAVLNLYFNVNKFVRVTPPTRDVIRSYITATDTSGADGIDRVEFQKLAKVLIGTVLMRAGTMLVATLLCPYVASKFVDLCIVVGGRIDDMFDDTHTTVDDCFQAILVRILPFFVNEQLADTAASIVLVSLGVPMLFSWYDSYFPTHPAKNLKEKAA